LAGLKAEWPSAYHIHYGFEASRPLELERRADGVTHGKAKEAPAKSLSDIHMKTPNLQNKPSSTDTLNHSVSERFINLP
jgi:hypothetical protein